MTLLMTLLMNLPHVLTCSEVSSEKRLVRRLLQGYQQIGKNGRPIRNASQAVQVHFGLGLIQMELNEKDKILSLSMWSRYVSAPPF